jgi:predicted RND superfamily exporter protein
MGVVIVGGTIFSLILTLFVIPAIYSLWSREYKPNLDLKEAEEVERQELKAAQAML